MVNEQHNPWQIIDQKEIYNNSWIRLVEYDVINPGGGKGIYGKVHFKNTAIGIVPLDDEENTWLVGQYRFPVNTYSWEIPEGGGIISVDPLASAKRELLEETGIKAEKWVQVLNMHISNSVTDENAIVYLARDLSFHNAEPEETEQLVVKKIPFTQAIQMVINGEITDSISVAALFKVHYLLTHKLL